VSDTKITKAISEAEQLFSTLEDLAKYEKYTPGAYRVHVLENYKVALSGLMSALWDHHHAITTERRMSSTTR
jgi:hypothetical protein